MVVIHMPRAIRSLAGIIRPAASAEMILFLKHRKFFIYGNSVFVLERVTFLSFWILPMETVSNFACLFWMVASPSTLTLFRLAQADAESLIGSRSFKGFRTRLVFTHFEHG
jgi:hypothetical protein